MQDSILQLFPWKHLVFQSLSGSILPLWNPYQLMGMPFMASMKPMVFYPLNLFYIFGEINAWHLLLFSQLFLSSIFTYILCRDFKLKPEASIIAALSFGYSSLMIGVLEFGSEGHVLLWLPLLIFIAKRFMEAQKSRYFMLLAFLIAFTILAGQLQYAAYEIITLIIFIFFYGRLLKIGLSVYVLLGVAVILGIGISAVQLLPSIELFNYSFRGVADSYNIFVNNLIRPYHLFRLFAPDLFGNPVTRDLSLGYIEDSGYFGLIPLFFSFYALIYARKNIFVRIFGLISISAGLLSIKGIGQILYYLHLPLVTSGNGQRIFFLVLFSGAILSGFGFQKFLETKHTKRNLLAIVIFGILSLTVFVSAIAIGRIIYQSNSIIHNLNFALMLLGFFMLSMFLYIIFCKKYPAVKYLFICVIIVLVYFDLFHLGYRFLTFSNVKFLYPETSVIQYVQNKSKNNLARNYRLVEPEIASYFNLYTAETYNPLYLLRSGQLLNALAAKDINDLPVNKYYLSTQNGRRLKSTLDLLGVLYIIGRKDVNPSLEYFQSGDFQSDLTKVYSDGVNDVFENRSALPRFSLYYKSEIINDDKKILAQMRLGTLNFKTNLILEKQLPIRLQNGQGTVFLLDSTVNSQTFSAISTKPALLYVSDTFFPGWEAKVNKKKTEIYRANYNFRAVLIPQGKSLIEFRYNPLSFKIGLCISLLSLVVVFMSVLTFNKIKR